MCQSRAAFKLEFEVSKKLFQVVCLQKFELHWSSTTVARVGDPTTPGILNGATFFFKRASVLSIGSKLL